MTINFMTDEERDEVEEKLFRKEMKRDTLFMKVSFKTATWDEAQQLNRLIDECERLARTLNIDLENKEWRDRKNRVKENPATTL